MFPVQIDPITIREARIAQLSAESTDTQLEPKYLTGTTKLTIIELPIESLLYRLENYRTGNLQKTLIAKDPEKAGLFDLQHSEDIASQRAQHALLLDLAKQGKGESTTDIYGELERVCRQTEALIITAYGIVVNGNRRLSAMRELLRENPETHRTFSHVRCAVLPKSAARQDIRDLEFRLQMQPDTKLPYDWTALGRGVIDMRADHYIDSKIALIMNREQKELSRAVAMVNSADRYLSDWLGTPNNFAALEQTEQAFIQIATKNKPRGDDAATREATLAADFFVIENRERLTDRAYKYINIIEENAELVLSELALALNIGLEEAFSNPAQDEFDFPSAPGIVRMDYAPVVDHLKALRENEEASKATIEKLIDVCLNVSQQVSGKEKAALNFALNSLKQLNSVDLTTAGVATHAELMGVLASVAQKAHQLGGQLGEMTTSN